MMKKLIIIGVIGLLCLPFTSYSQNLDDALRFNKREITGTSRSLGMANAFGALGGDLTAISINPAGIAVYRTSEFSFTPSLSINYNTSKFGKHSSNEDEFSLPINQIGGVMTQKTLREKSEGLISTHFGFTYNRTADFNSIVNSRLLDNVKDIYDNETGEPIVMNTLLTNILWEANGYTPDDMSDRAYLALKNFLIVPTFVPDDKNPPTEYYSEYEYRDDINGTIYDRNVNGIDQHFRINESGYSGEYGFTFGANIDHVFLIGGSLNFQSFNFKQTKILTEINSNGFNPSTPYDLDYYNAYQHLNQNGFGVNGKFGMILNLNPVRIGASIHSPTFYGIDEEYYNGIESFYLNKDQYMLESDLGTSSYNYRTPYRVQGSMAFILGKKALLSFDYEMTDNTSSKITSTDRYIADFSKLNDDIKKDLQISHDFKAGAEIKPLPYLSIRVGFAYYDSPLKKEIYKLDKWMYTGGFGLRNGNFFFDAAYAQTVYDDSFFINTDQTIWQGLSFDESIQISSRRHQASFTFGWKF